MAAAVCRCGLSLMLGGRMVIVAKKLFVVPLVRPVAGLYRRYSRRPTYDFPSAASLSRCCFTSAHGQCSGTCGTTSGLINCSYGIRNAPPPSSNVPNGCLLAAWLAGAAAVDPAASAGGFSSTMWMFSFSRTAELLYVRLTCSASVSLSCSYTVHDGVFHTSY